jgi:hypothetical protein
MPFGLKFDISIGKSNGLEAVTLIREQLQKWPALRPLVTILKLYLLQRNMNEVFTGGLSSYALIISVVAFLQLHQSRVEALIRALLTCHSMLSTCGVYEVRWPSVSGCTQVKLVFVTDAVAGVLREWKVKSVSLWLASLHVSQWLHLLPPASARILSGLASDIA